jgi:MFS family permease
MSAYQDLRTTRRAFLLLTALRWFPTGMTIPISVLFATSRGLSLTEVGVTVVAQSVVVVALELPTGGLSDAWGRRPVLAIAALAAVGSIALLLSAHTLAAFVAAKLLQGLFRALDSGPLEAWYVDVALAADPDRDLSGDLSRAGVVLYAAIGTGSLLSAGVTVLPGLPVDPLTAVIAVSLVFEVVHGIAVLALLREDRAAAGWGAARAAVLDVPRVIRSGIGLAWRHRPLRWLLAVELFWGFGLTAVETLWQPQLSAVSGPDRQDWLFGVLSAAAWATGAAGALLVRPLVRLCGGRVAVASAALRIVQGAATLLLGLATGPIGVITGYIGFYVVHGAANPTHFALMHRRVDDAQRATMISMNSLLSSLSGAAGGLLLGALADRAGIPLALAVAAAILAAAAPLYLLSGEPPTTGVDHGETARPASDLSPSSP